MGKYFGTDGVRGVANIELTPQLAFKLGRAGAHVLGKGKEKLRISIGKDTRLSGDMLESALIAGICSMGGDVIRLDIMPTPGVAVLTRELEADAGIMISASHNPAEFNGIKFFNKEGLKLSDEVELEIEKIIDDDFKYNMPTGKSIGKVIDIENPIDIYMNMLLQTVDLGLEGQKIVIDCANGANSEIAPKIFRKLGAEIISIGDCPNGININDNCGSTHLELLQDTVLESRANFGLAFDGDADRLLAVDDLGRIVDGDKLMSIFASSMKKEGKLKKNTLVSTVMSNMGLEKALEKIGCKIVKTAVGDRYVLESMLKEGYNLGGEQSGHIVMLDYNTTGDGLLTALQLSCIVKKEGKCLSELADKMKEYPQVLINAKVKNENKHSYRHDKVIMNEIAKIERHFHNKGRVLIRPSGTEPLVRVMLEGEEQEELQQIAQELVDIIEKRLG